MAGENDARMAEKARNFDVCRQAALDWLETNSTTKEWQLLCADETDRNLFIQHQTRGTSFIVTVSTSKSNTKQLRFTARCDNESEMRLPEAYKMDSIEECLESSIRALDQYVKNDGSEDEDYDDMEEDYYKNGEMDLEEEDQDSGKTARKKDSSGEAMEIPKAELEMYCKSGSKMAVHRLLSDYKKFQESNGMYGFRGSPREDNLFLWDVQLVDFEKKSPLYKDLVKYAEKYNRKREIDIEMSFPSDYPMSPPFIRVIRPRFKFLTGHVTIGGSICMELLTKSGWTPAHDIESTLVQVRSAITSDPDASLDLTDSAREYDLTEAHKAFKRMVRNHGWSY